MQKKESLLKVMLEQLVQADLITSDIATMAYKEYMKRDVVANEVVNEAA